MSGELQFSDPVDLAEDLAAFLPYNYLPAAFPSIMRDPGAKSRLLFILPDQEDCIDGPPARRAPTYAVVDPASLCDPEATARVIQAICGTGAPPNAGRIFLGPEVSDVFAAEVSRNKAMTVINAAPASQTDLAAFDSAVVIIDAGIAFWNRRFRGPCGPRFRDVRFLDFERTDLGLQEANLLDPSEIKAYCALADAEGPGRVMEELGRAFPNSFYGKAASPDVDGIWHGTAVADLAAGADPESADAMDRVALFGIELPASVLRASDGDALTAVLTILLDQVLEITQGIGNKPLIVALPFGFVGGPQDGSHPAAQTIDAILTANPARAGSDFFLVPAGNHLQDRCRARLPQAQSGVPLLSVDWQIPPDDFSTNQIEILIDNVDPADDRASLRIAPPGPAAVQSVGLKAGQHQLVTLDGATVGMLMRYANVAMPAPQADLRARLRLCVAPTGFRPGGGTPAPFGCWRLSTQSVQPVDLWVLRDDRDPVGDGAFPCRTSWLDDPLYQDRGWTGAPGLHDDPGSLILRSGTLSVLATALSAHAVQAMQRFGPGPGTKAFYSGSPELTAADLSDRLEAQAKLVDDGRMTLGRMTAANGTERVVRFSGTSAAVGLAARDLGGAS